MYTLGRDVTDIDTFDDLATARRRLERWDLVFDYVANERIGWGHKARCETLAAELDHRVLYRDRLPELHYYMEAPPSGRGVWVVDRLDNSVGDIAEIVTHGWKVLTLEDRGPGARHADAIVNALYPIGHLPQEHSGPDWVVLRPEFQGLPARSYDCLLYTSPSPRDRS